MPLTISNTVTRPANAAIQSKINPQQLTPPANSFMVNQPVPTAQPTTPSVTQGPGLIPQIMPKAAAPAPVPAPAIQASYQGGQAVPAVGTAAYQAAQKLSQAPVNPPNNTPAPAPAAPVPSQYSGLISQGTGALQQQAELQKKIAMGVSAVEGNPNYSVDTQVGRAGLIQRNLGTQAQALGQEASAAFQGAQAMQPVSVPYGVQYGSPVDLAAANAPGGTAGGSGAPGGALNPLNNVTSIAQQIISGKLSPSQGYALGGNVSNFQGLLNAEIQKQSPGFNTGTAQGKFDANQSNTTVSGTAPTNAASAAYQAAYPQLLDLQNTTQNVDQFGTLLLNSMVDPNGNTINPNDVKFANTTLANIKSQLSDAQQAVFDNTFASLKSRVSGLLAMGGSEIPTQITADANKIIDGSLPLSSLSAVLQRISTEGKILTSNLQNKLNTAGSVIGAPKSGANNNPAGI